MSRDYNYDNGTGFRSSDYPLSYQLQLEIVNSLAESLEYAIENKRDTNIYEILDNTIDSTIPVYYSDILRQWDLAGCPDPVDNDYGSIDPDSSAIWQLMTRALWQAMYDFASGVVYNSDDDLIKALERINTIYPEKVDA